MQKSLPKYKILISLFVFINIFNASALLAKEGSIARQREILVENELLCVEKSLKVDGEISWDDVCSLYASNRESNPMRKDIIDNALNEFERKKKNEENRWNQRKRNPVKERKQPSWKKPSRTQYQRDIPADRSQRFQQSSREFQKKVRVVQNKNLRRVKGDVQFLSGYRVDKMNWSIAGEINGKNPNFSLENEWSNIRIAQFQTKGAVVVDDVWVVDGMGAIGTIVDGQSRESEYRADNRGNEFSRINGNTDGNNAWDFSVGLGYRYIIKDLDNYPKVVDALALEPTLFLDNFWITALGGYSFHKLNLKTTDGNQTIDTLNSFGLGPFPGLNNKYESQWKGPWIGMEVYGDIKKLWSKLRFGYHFADYSAESDLNLRTDVNHPKSFEHEANGRGQVVNFSMGYNMTQQWSLDFNLDFQRWKTQDGIDRLFLNNGTVSETRLNKVEWRSLSFMLGTTYRF